MNDTVHAEINRSLIAVGPACLPVFPLQFDQLELLAWGWVLLSSESSFQRPCTEDMVTSSHLCFLASPGA